MTTISAFNPNECFQSCIWFHSQVPVLCDMNSYQYRLHPCVRAVCNFGARACIFINPCPTPHLHAGSSSASLLLVFEEAAAALPPAFHRARSQCQLRAHRPSPQPLVHGQTSSQQRASCHLHQRTCSSCCSLTSISTCHLPASGLLCAPSSCITRSRRSSSCAVLRPSAPALAPDSAPSQHLHQLPSSHSGVCCSPAQPSCHSYWPSGHPPPWPAADSGHAAGPHVL